jgi:hypothetical protein
MSMAPTTGSSKTGSRFYDVSPHPDRPLPSSAVEGRSRYQWHPRVWVPETSIAMLACRDAVVAPWREPSGHWGQWGPWLPRPLLAQRSPIRCDTTRFSSGAVPQITWVRIGDEGPLPRSPHSRPAIEKCFPTSPNSPPPPAVSKPRQTGKRCRVILTHRSRASEFEPPPIPSERLPIWHEPVTVRRHELFE